nr:FixH family protein [Paenactinomyces guangxiensis]
MAICFALFALLLTACNQPANQHQNHNGQQNTPAAETLKLSFQTNPASPAVGKHVTLQATVKEGSQPVDDAKVEFEVWKQGEKDHQKIDSKLDGKGTYTATTAFQDQGEYLVIVHVTTSKVHQMISGKFTVGQPHSHQGHGKGLTMHVVLPPRATSGQSAPITAHVMQGGNPVTGAEVQFEYWREGEKKHEYTDTAERKPGEYYTSIRFPQPGTYHVKLHVEKGKLHDHKEETLVVK